MGGMKGLGPGAIGPWSLCLQLSPMAPVAANEIFPMAIKIKSHYCSNPPIYFVRKTPPTAANERQWPPIAAKPLVPGGHHLVNRKLVVVRFPSQSQRQEFPPADPPVTPVSAFSPVLTVPAGTAELSVCSCGAGGGAGEECIQHNGSQPALLRSKQPLYTHKICV